MSLTIEPVSTRAGRRRFVDLAWALNCDDPQWVPPLKSEVHGLLRADKNPWFEHAEAALFLAVRDGRDVGRISAQVDRLVLEMPFSKGGGAGTGQWGFLEATDAEVASALLAAAEAWLHGRGMTRALGPFSLSIWDEPGLLVEGHDQPPTVMMGHNSAAYATWVEAAGYARAKDLYTYELDITQTMPEIVQRIVATGERNPRISIRKVDKRRFGEEAAIILRLLNDAWSDNWGFVPLTDTEIAYVGKKLKPIVYEDLIMIAEYDREPVAFMITLPDLNEVLRGFDGKLLPFNWARLLLWMRKPKVHGVRVPLMGVTKRLQASRLASQLAFMLIETIRAAARANYGATRGEIGWILEDNQGMRAIADTIDTRLNKVYRIYEKAL